MSGLSGGGFQEISCKNVRFVRFTPPPLTTIRNETFFRVDGGWRRWHCLTDAQRYYTTLQFWQVTGSADGCSSKWGRVWGVSLASDTGCGRDARVPRAMSPNLDHTRQMGRIQDIWRASRPILSTTPGEGETPAILKVLCIGVGNESLSAKKPSNPGGYAIISDAPGSDSSSGAAFEEPASPRELQDGITHRAADCNDCGSLR